MPLNLGLALFWQRDDAGALAAWKQAKRVQPDTPSAVRAGDLLHPNSPNGLPRFVPSFTRAQTRVQRLLVAGIRLQQSDRPLSAEREFSRAAELAPDDPDAQVAAAVGLYDKDRPAAAFARLGPLVRRFPHAQTVRFHLGLLSIWLGDFAQARREFGLVVAENPRSSYAREARRTPKTSGEVLGPNEGKMSRSAYGGRPKAMQHCRIARKTRQKPTRGVGER